MASLSILYLVVGVIAFVAGGALLAVALSKRGDAANVGATAMLIGGMMVMTFGLLMSAFWVAFATGGPANLTAENVQ